MTTPDIQSVINSIVTENAKLKQELAEAKVANKLLEEELQYAMHSEPESNEWFIVTITGGTGPKDLERFDKKFEELLNVGMKCIWQAIDEGLVLARFRKAKDDGGGLDDRLYTLPEVDDYVG